MKTVRHIVCRNDMTGGFSMLNWLWGGMILIGVIYGAFNGRMADITNMALDSSREAVSLCITMMGVMSLWVGLMKIAESAGIIKGLSARMKPILRFLFPEVPDDHPAQKHMAVNMIANVLGLGWAATPAGLRAMEELQKLNHGSTLASNAMCSFLILNISSLQLIPVNVIAYRSQYGSVNPAGIIGAGIVATAVSTATGILFCKMMDWKKK